MTGLERRAKDLEVALVAEKGKASYQVEESAIEVMHLEWQSRTLQAHLEAVMARPQW